MKIGGFRLVIAAALASVAAASFGQPPQIGGCDLFPAENVWNTPVDHLPVHPDSDLMIDQIGRYDNFHPDFGSGVWPPGSDSPIGIPWATVDHTQATTTPLFGYDSESDTGPYPIPLDPPIEGGPDSEGDRHVLLVETSGCDLYETFFTWPPGTEPTDPETLDWFETWCISAGSWCAGSGAVFDLASNDLRPDGWTSGDAAGLPILPGLVRYDEVAAGEIRHAIRFTVAQTRNGYVWPARHEASSLNGDQYPPMGQRFRLKAGYDIATFSPGIQVILRAMKRYGILLADNGSNWFLSGEPNESWDNDELRQLRDLVGDDFEAVDGTLLMLHPDSGATNYIFADDFASGDAASWSALVP